MKTPTNSRKARLFIVTIGGIFVFSIVVLAKFVGDGPVVPLIFLIGWLCLALLTFKFFSGYDPRAK